MLLVSISVRHLTRLSHVILQVLEHKIMKISKFK